MNNNFLYRGEQILQTLWVGGLWVVGYLVVPLLFNTLDDRLLAGALAGQMFAAMNVVGLICGAVLLIVAAITAKTSWLKNSRVIVLVLMLISIAVAALVLQPMMQELKAVGLLEGSDAAKQFGRLHGVSSVMYLLNSLLGLYLVLQSRQR